MSSVLFADYGHIRASADRLGSASTSLETIGVGSDSSWSGSTAVSAVLDETTRIRAARAQAVAQLLIVKQSSVRDAVAEMLAADTAASRAVRAR